VDEVPASKNLFNELREQVSVNSVQRQFLTNGPISFLPAGRIIIFSQESIRLFVFLLLRDGFHVEEMYRFFNPADRQWKRKSFLTAGKIMPAPLNQR